MRSVRGVIVCFSCACTCAFACIDAGCSPDDGSSGDSGGGCALPFVGDKTADIQLQIEARGADGTAHVIDDGSDVALIFPPQGGRVVFVGPRATNIDPCYVKLTGALRDETSGQLRLDGRTVLLTPTGDGWATSLDADISSFSNIATCPNQWATVDVYDHSFSLELSVVDRAGRKATKSIHVTPRCAEPDRAAECHCICAAGYVLGEPCASFDAGVDSGDGGG